MTYPLNFLESEYLSNVESPTIKNGLIKTYKYLLSHNNIAVSVSGGADSDDMIDVVENIKKYFPEEWKEKSTIRYVWFDTGIEMEATKRHLNFLESKYLINIERIRSMITVPAAVLKAGYPFISKDVSQKINNLQTSGFGFEDDTLEELEKKYSKCKTGLTWWTGNRGSYSISRNLKKYMIDNPPDFHISDFCCHYAKKEPSRKFILDNNIDLMLIGVRQAEGGIRSTIGSCFVEKGKSKVCDQHYPLFWWTDEDKRLYEQIFNIKHSDAYEVYGFKRTGCAGCPFNSKYKDDLQILEQYEPRLANAVKNIFRKSYEYTEGYKSRGE